MKIAIDAMGGDYAPDSVVKGAIDAIKDYKDTEVLLVGLEDAVKSSVEKYLPGGDPRISVVHAEQIINMGDIPSQVVRGKRNSSLHTALRLVKEGKADACYSAGNTGATMATAVLILRTLEGIDRPAIATVLPSLSGHFVLLDVGANVDTKIDNYFQFAIMGTAYAKSVMNKENPTVGLLSIGEEDSKGNETTKTVFTKLKESNIVNFIGNVEPKEMFQGKADVIVCDGFVGNIALKSTEGVAMLISTILKQELTSSFFSKIGALIAKKGLLNFRKRVDHEEYGGAPLLGVGGVCIIGHGSSGANAVKNAVRVAREIVLENMNSSIENDVKISFQKLKKENGIV